MINTTRAHLADGRELLYFDDSEPYASGAARRDAVDRRQLPPFEHEARMRYDELTGEWVALASHRLDRTYLPPADECPLCPTRPGKAPTEIPADDYDVVVFENRFPSFAALPDDAADPSTAGDQPAVGRCEVVCFTSDHDTSFGELDTGRVRTVIEAWVHRTTELSARPGVEQVAVWENRGREIGVTLHHPHGQIYAYPFVSPRGEAMVRQGRHHAETTGRELLGDVLDAELREAERVVAKGEHWTAFVPAAARWPVEVRLVPHRRVPDLAALDGAERDELALVYPDLLRRFDAFYPGVDAVPYVAAWHQAPVRPGVDRDRFRLHLQAFSILRAPGKLKYLAGSESALGAWINDTTPERIAARLREVAG